MTSADGRIAIAEVQTRDEFKLALRQAAKAADLTGRGAAQKSKTPRGTVGDWFSGKAIPGVESYEYLTALLIALGIPVTEIPLWKAAADRARQRPEPPTYSPYPGLEAFDAERSDVFCGRDELAQKLRALVHDALAGTTSTVIVVVGSSGAGKSSLLRAGLIPTLDVATLMNPGTHPLEALTNVTDGHEQSESEQELVLVVDQCEELWTLEPPTVADKGRATGTDQWDIEREEFLTRLGDMAARPRSAVVVALRADYFGNASTNPVLLAGLNQTSVLVGPLETGELRQVIVAPAARYGVTVDEALVDRLLEELAVPGSRAAHDPGTLPLLSHALMETWFQRSTHPKRMTVEDYHGTGRIRGAVQKTAELVYGRLDATQQRIAQRVMTRSVVIGDGALARRRVDRSELAWDDTRRADVDEVVERFAAARLLTVSDTGVQISHEALLMAWSRLVKWINEDRANLLVHRRIGTETEQWLHEGRSDKGLVSEGRTEFFEQWAADVTNSGEMSSAEREFVAYNVLHYADVARRKKRNARILRAISVAAVILAVVSTGSMVYAFGQRNSAQTARDEALSRQAAVTSEQIRGVDPALAQQLALAAFRISPTLEARSALLDSTAVPTPQRTPTTPGPTAAALNSDGSLIAVANSDGNARIIDRQRPRTGAISTIPIGVEPLYSVAFQPNTALLAVGGAVGVTLWDLSHADAPQPRGELDGTSGPTYDLAWSPDGQQLAAATLSGVVRWNILNGTAGKPEPPLPGEKGSSAAVAYSPDGALLATGGENAAVQLWRRSPDPTPALVGSYPMADGAQRILDVQFDLSSKRLAISSRANEVTVVSVDDPATPVATHHLGGFKSYVNSGVFSADGNTIVAGSSDNTTALFDLSGAQPPRILPGPAIVTSVALASNDIVVSASVDGIIREWPLPGPVTPNLGGKIYVLQSSSDGTAVVGLIAPKERPDLNVLHQFDLSDPRGVGERGGAMQFAPGTRMNGVAAISNDGKLAAGGTMAGEIYLWDIAGSASVSPKMIGTPTPVIVGGTAVTTAVFSADGHSVFAASADDNSHQVVMVDHSDRSRVRVVESLDAGDLVQLLAVSPNGRLLAAATASGVVVWDISAGPGKIRRTAQLSGFESLVSTVRFSPDSKTLAAGSDDKTARLWDVEDPTTPIELAHLTGPSGAIQSLTFNWAGTHLAGGIGSHQIWVWDVTDRTAPTRVAALNANVDRVNDVAYGPSDTDMTAASLDGVLRTWATDPETVATALCADSAAIITESEWSQYLPDTAYRHPCAE